MTLAPHLWTSGVKTFITNSSLTTTLPPSIRLLTGFDDVTNARVTRASRNKQYHSMALVAASSVEGAQRLCGNPWDPFFVWSELNAFVLKDETDVIIMARQVFLLHFEGV